MAVKYTSKRWLETPVAVEELIRKLGFRLIGELDPDNYVVKRRGDTSNSFNVLHISWGDNESVEKYKLFKVNVFEP